MSERSRDGGFSRYKHPTSPFTPGGNRQPVAAADGRATPAFPEAAELVVEYRWPLAALAAGLFLIWVLQVCPHPPAPPGGASTTAIGTASRAFDASHHVLRGCATAAPQRRVRIGFAGGARAATTTTAAALRRRPRAQLAVACPARRRRRSAATAGGNHRWRGRGGPGSRRRDCHFPDIPSPSMLKHPLKAEGGAAE